jgi:exopolysaccharide biosynthesis polyprenyl glycosylphosphotransferase
MLKPALVALGAGFRLFDLAALAVAFPLACDGYARVAGAPPPLPPGTIWPAVVLAVVLWSVSAWGHRLYETPAERSAFLEAERALRTFGVMAVVLAAGAFLADRRELSRLLVALYFGVAAVLVVGARLCWRAVALVARRGHDARRYAVVGTGAMAREIVEAVEAHPEWGLRFAGFVRLAAAGDPTRGPTLGVVSELGRILDAEVLDVVVFAVPRERLGDIDRAIRVCEEQGVEVRISLDLLRFGPGRVTLGEMDGVPVLAFTRAPSDVLALVVKRVFDVAVSAAVLLALAPVFAAIAIAIRLDSPGPVVFRQRRVGRNGRPFEMLKFRSMYRDAEQRLGFLREKNEMSGPVFKMTNDPRVTRVGRFLRRTSLDELPQFWNVLRGEMSVVGPRPPIASEVRQYKRWQRRRLSVRPGITCTWQISGRNEIDFDEWMELDLEYIDQWSLWRDLEICAKTIPAVLSARGAR